MADPLNSFLLGLAIGWALTSLWRDRLQGKIIDSYQMDLFKVIGERDRAYALLAEAMKGKRDE